MTDKVPGDSRDEGHHLARNVALAFAGIAGLTGAVIATRRIIRGSEPSGDPADPSADTADDAPGELD